MASININKVNKYFGNTHVIKDVSLDIKSESFTVLVGPSGCGKSTILRMIAGLEEINSGTISIDDKVVNDLPPKERNIAMVFQSYALYPHMTVFDNMAFGLKIEKKSKEEIEQRVMEAAKILQIEEYLERKPKQLSGGQRQRVAIGRAITRKPKVFLFDEPLSNLDAALRVQILFAVLIFLFATITLVCFLFESSFAKQGPFKTETFIFLFVFFISSEIVKIFCFFFSYFKPLVRIRIGLLILDFLNSSLIKFIPDKLNATTIKSYLFFNK